MAVPVGHSYPFPERGKAATAAFGPSPAVAEVRQQLPQHFPVSGVAAGGGEEGSHRFKGYRTLLGCWALRWSLVLSPVVSQQGTG